MESVEIRWPNGATEKPAHVPADAIYTVVEGSGIRDTKPLPPPGSPVALTRDTIAPQHQISQTLAAARMRQWPVSRAQHAAPQPGKMSAIEPTIFPLTFLINPLYYMPR